MPSKVIDTICGAISALLAMAVGTLISSYEWTPERLLAAEAADREGPYVNSPLPDPIPDPVPTVIVGVTLTTEDIWLAEMELANVPISKLAEYYGQIVAESSFNPRAESPAKARGLAQGMPRTIGEEYPRTEPSCEDISPYEPACSARFQVSYRDRITHWLPPDARTPELEQAAYNWGIGSIRKVIAMCRTLPGCNPLVWATIEPFVPAETKGYIVAIARHAESFNPAAP